MRRKGRTLLTLGLAAMTAAAVCTEAFAGSWQPDGAQWKYLKDDGAATISDWYQDTGNGVWYHFDDQGHMQTGWITVEGKSYYFDPTGAMLSGTATPDGYYVGTDGAWVENSSPASGTLAGWQQDSTGWWYQTASGTYLSEKWKTIDGKRYYFGSDGYMATGLQNIDGNDYYFNPDGSMAKKNFSLDGVYYYVESDGVITDQVDLDDYYDFGGGYSSWDYGDGSSNGYQTTDDGHNLSYAMEVIDIVNKERRKKGLDEVAVNDTLMEAAATRAEEIVEEFAHTRPDGSYCLTVIKDAGLTYTSAGENIAYGQTSPESVMAAWMDSAGHKKNILTAGFGEIGVGCYIYNGTCYWVQLFINGN